MTHPSAPWQDHLVRGSFKHDGLQLSYLDSGPAALPVLLALHGHLNEARFIWQGAVPAGLPYRVIALDQRGHGESDHAATYLLDQYVDDALALMDHLAVATCTVLGHSLGGAVAYTLAARAVDRVDAIVVVDIGARITGDLSITRTWPHRTRTRARLVESMGAMGHNQRYVTRHYPDGWGVPWDADHMTASQLALNGDHWEQWLASPAPALLLHGTASGTLSRAHADDMARQRNNTTVRHLTGGHAIYIDNPNDYSQEVTAFLGEGPDLHRPRAEADGRPELAAQARGPLGR